MTGLQRLMLLAEEVDDMQRVDKWLLMIVVLLFGLLIALVAWVAL